MKNYKNYKERYKRKNFVSLCLSDKEMAEVDELTKKLDLTRAAAIRELLLTSTKKLKNRIHKNEDREQLFLLSSISNNINQIAKKINTNIEHFLSGNGEQFVYLLDQIVDDIEKIKRGSYDTQTNRR
ncbi:plasmid mobilization relaxosome protein MobC [Providencia stuartii]|uniref:plasmid mobilization relaxosome protein MobC n=1 Tax=Providencia stuartii TaxID=588 RepID=UPI0034D4B532